MPEIPSAVAPVPTAAPNLPEGSGSVVDPPVSTHIKLLTKLARKLKEVAESRLWALILNVDMETDGAPNDELCNKMICNALQAAKIKQFGQNMFHWLPNLKYTDTVVIVELRTSRGSATSWWLH
jgi:hypothetical protein